MIAFPIYVGLLSARLERTELENQNSKYILDIEILYKSKYYTTKHQQTNTNDKHRNNNKMNWKN
jgi:hypothetical protein